MISSHRRLRARSPPVDVLSARAGWWLRTSAASLLTSGSWCSICQNRCWLAVTGELLTAVRAGSSVAGSVWAKHQPSNPTLRCSCPAASSLKAGQSSRARLSF